MDPAKITRATVMLVEAFTGGEGLKNALEEVAVAAGARGAAIIPLNVASGQRTQSNAIEDGMELYDRSWANRDFRKTSIPKMLAAGIAVDQDIITADGMRRLPFYTDFLASFGLRWFAGVPIQSRDEVWCLAIQRTPEQGLFELHEQASLRELGASISKAVPTAQMLAAARVSGVMSGLNAAGVPALLLDRTGLVLEFSRSVNEVMANDLGIRLGRVLFSSPRAISELVNCIDAVSGPTSRPLDHSSMIVNRAGRRPLFLSFKRVTPEGARYFSNASVVVLIDDPDRNSMTSPQTLMKAFGLTPAQARVAMALGQGHSIKSCAEELDVGTETVRTALQKIFVKMNIVRQSELVGILARLRS